MTEENKRRAELRAAFLYFCKKADANLMIHWDQQERCWPLYLTLSASLESSDGPDFCEVMQLLLNLAKGNNLLQSHEHAKLLLERMATAYAEVSL